MTEMLSGRLLPRFSGVQLIAVKSLRLWLDFVLSLDRQVSMVPWLAFCHYNRPSILFFVWVRSCHSDSCKGHSSLDYCNLIYIGLTSKVLWKLEVVQNAAARLLTETSLSAHITSILQQLH